MHHVRVAPARTRLVALVTALATVLAITVPVADAAARPAASGRAATTKVTKVAVTPSSRIVLPKKPLRLTLSASTLAPGSKVKSVTVTWGDKKQSTVRSLTAHPVHRYQKPGRFVVRVTLVDTKHRMSRTTFPILVTHPNHVKLKASTKTVTARQVTSVTTMTNGMQQVVLAPGVTATVGKAIEAPVTPALPTGLLGIVTKTSPTASGTTVMLKPANLSQAYTDFSSSIDVKLGQSKAFLAPETTPTTQRPAATARRLAAARRAHHAGHAGRRGDDVGERNYSNAVFSCSTDGKIVHKINVDLSQLDIQGGADVDSLSAHVDITGPVTSSLTLGFEGSISCSLSDKVAIYLPVLGPVDVKIHPVLELGADGHVTVTFAVTHQIDIHAAAGASIPTRFDHSVKVVGHDVSFEGQAVVTAKIGLEVSLQLAGIAGIGGNLSANGQATVTVSGNTGSSGSQVSACATIEGWLSGNLFAEISVFFFSKKIEFLPFELLHTTFYNKCTTSTSPTTTYTDVSLHLTSYSVAADGATTNDQTQCDAATQEVSTPFYVGGANDTGAACATLLSVDGVLYGPQHIPGASSLGAVSAYSDAFQESSGSGTTDSPYTITTEVDAGPVQLVEVDTYVAQSDHVSTTYTLFSNDTTSHSVVLYHAIDCGATDAEQGQGSYNPSADFVGCSSATSDENTNDFVGLANVSGNDSYLEADKNTLWSAIAGQPSQLGDTINTTPGDTAIAQAWAVTTNGDQSGTTVSDRTYLYQIDKSTS